MLRSSTARAAASVAILLILLACNLGRVPAASPVAAPAGIPIFATPVRLTIPESLATGVTAETIDVVTDQTGAPWDVAPAHLQLTFQGYALASSFHVPQLFIYPAQQYAGLNPAAAESLKRLQSLLASPGPGISPEALPRVPFFNAGQVFAAQPKLIRFAGGSGVRFITQYAQDVSPINNSGLFYQFQGLAQDGKYYLIAILPVNLPFLPADNDPAAVLPSGGVPFPSSSAPGSDFENYYKQVAARIEAATADQFTPPLAELDQLAQSISVDP